MKERKQAIKTVLAIIVFTILSIYLVYHAYVISNIFSRILSLLFPFILGCAIAFVINIPMRGIENLLFKDPSKKIYKAKRPISMLLAYVFVVLIIVLVLFEIIPEMADTFTVLKEKVPEFVDKTKKWLLKYVEKFPEIKQQITDFEIDLDAIGNMFKNNGSTILSTTVSIFSSIISVVTNVVIGFVFSLYILSNKELLGRQVKMVVYALCKENVADELLVFSKIANTTFSKFFACQFREAIIIGCMFLLTMSVIGMPSAVTIGVLIGFTALIPVFGAFIGLFISCFMLFVIAPKYVIWFVIMFFVLQFIENNFIYPKLVGGDVGLSPIWVLLAVIVGGDLMGVVGMFIFIPLISVFYAYFRSIIYRRLRKKKVNVEEKEAPADVVPLMESRRRLFQRKAKELREKNKKKGTVEEVFDETEEFMEENESATEEAKRSDL